MPTLEQCLCIRPCGSGRTPLNNTLGAACAACIRLLGRAAARSGHRVSPGVSTRCFRTTLLAPLPLPLHDGMLRAPRRNGGGRYAARFADSRIEELTCAPTSSLDAAPNVGFHAVELEERVHLCSTAAASRGARSRAERRYKECCVKLTPSAARPQNQPFSPEAGLCLTTPQRLLPPTTFTIPGHSLRSLFSRQA